jgi:PPP family 3-phenylpropionic acid transporter
VKKNINSTQVTVVSSPKKALPPYTAFLLFNFVFFMLDTTASYFQIYLNDIGFTKTMIGTVSGTASLVALFFQPIFGAVADASKSKTRILQLFFLITAVLYPLLLINNSMAYILIIYTVFVVFRRFQPSLNTAMSVEFSEQSGKPYGPIRMMGAIGYALMMMLISHIAGQEGGIPRTFYMFTAIAMVNIVILFFLPKMEGHNTRTSGSKVSPAALLKCKPVITLILFQILLSIANSFGNSYFSLFFTKDIGGSNALYGTMLSVSAFIEIPFLFLSDKLIKKLGTRRMFMVLGIITACRWLVCFLAHDTTTLFVVRCFNFISILEVVTYSLSLSRLVSPRFKTSVQTLSATIQNVASILLTSYLGGFLADLIGIRPLFLVSAILVAVVVTVFCGFVLNFDDSASVFEG